MRISVVYTNRNTYLCPAPVGGLLVAQRLAADGHDVDFIDLMHMKKPADGLVAALHRHNPDLVCFSIRNVDNMTMDAYADPLPDIAGYARHVRNTVRAPLLIGGTAVTTFPAQIRAMTGADWAYAGDDVDPVSRFVASVAQGAPDLATPGLVYADETGVHENPFSICGYADAHFGGWERIDLKKYRKGYFDCGVVTCTGCPHGCSFCDAHRTFGRDYRPRDSRTVVEELIELERRFGARSVFLINNGLNYPLESGKELLARIAQAKLKLSFSCIIEPGPMDAEFARLLFRANCSSAMIFGSTLDDAALERNQPHYRSADIAQIAGHLSDANVPFMLGLMFGGIGETGEGVKRSLDSSLAMKPVMRIMGTGFRIQPDTPLRDAAVAEGQITADDDCFTARFYEPADTSTAEIRAIIRQFSRSHPFENLRMLGFVARSIREGLFGRSRRASGDWKI